MGDATPRYETANGVRIPAVGFGTYHIPKEGTQEAVLSALEAGYRHVDTAMGYGNEVEVGAAVRESGIDRGDVFLTTKVLGYREIMFRDTLVSTVEGCLDRLGVDYVDLLLLHWWDPVSDMADTFRTLGELVEAGLVRNVGVSNFSVEQLEEAVAVSPVPVLTNQVEYHAYFDRTAMLECCREHGVLLTAYSPLRDGLVVDDPVLADIGARYGKTAAQIAIRWLVQQGGVVTIPRTTNPEHVRDNIDVFDFELTAAEMRRIDALEGPLVYRLNKEGGAMYRFRGAVGPLVPGAVRRQVNRAAALILS